MSMNPYFADDGHLLSLPHRFSSSRNLELYVFAFVDEMNRSTHHHQGCSLLAPGEAELPLQLQGRAGGNGSRSEEHTSELQSRGQLVCRLLLEKKKILSSS